MKETLKLIELRSKDVLAVGNAGMELENRDSKTQLEVTPHDRWCHTIK